MDDESASEYGRWTKDALIRRIKALEYELRAKDQQVALAATSGGTGSAATANSPSEDGRKAELEPAREPEAKVEAKAETELEPPKKKKKTGRGIDPSKYSTRLVALKLAYLGKNYGGFEYQPTTKVPTIEEELWKAMVKGCLIFPENPDIVNWDSIEYSKCGRTDRGVSAFGQVIGVRVRSNRPLPKPARENPTETSDSNAATGTTSQGVGEAETQDATERSPAREFNDLIDELPYPRLLNRLLPPDIRVLAWCPTTPAEFSARHHCRERQYRYFFTQPAFSPTPESLVDPKRRQDGKRPKDGWLDIDAMRAAAKKFEGLHDFRNFCKIDGSKPQLTFTRRIFESDIIEVPNVETALPYLQDSEFRPAPSPSSPSEPSTTASPPPAPPQENFPKVYYFHVRGSAFLWHQIRCMVAVLFLVGQGLEDASVIDSLLDVAAEPRRPAYILAHETPLVLWDCLFPTDLDDPSRRDGMEWVHVGERCALHAHGGTGLVDHLWRHWRERKMDEILASQLLGVVAGRADLGRRGDPSAPRYAAAVQTVFKGGDSERSEGAYVPLLKKSRLPSPEEAFDKDAKRRGYESAAHVLEVMAQRRAAAEAAGSVEVIQT